ncbi:deoxyribose-phosphate aldolase [Xylariaceae sp. FL0662B]|nr:deoxyribose-phosphate aldolase [Xylariaceae sp. FL0662B]
MATPLTVTASLPQIAKLIDHSLLHPTMTDSEILAGIEVAKRFKVASACVKPYSVPAAKNLLEGSGVLVCAVIGFPHGNSTTAVKVIEAENTIEAGAQEIDMVVNVGKVLSGDWEYVRNEIRAINETVTRHGAILKVIFENDFLHDEHIVHLCKLCTDLSVAFVKTSTGYGFVKLSNGLYTYRGATIPHLKLMKATVGPNVQVKAAGGIRTLDECLYAMSLGATRIGATSTVAILEEAASRGLGNMPKEIAVSVATTVNSQGGSY